MGYLVILIVEKSAAAPTNATTATLTAAQRGGGPVRRSSSVQIELLQVGGDQQTLQRQQADTDADVASGSLVHPSPRIRLSRHHAGSTADSTAATLSASLCPPSHSGASASASASTTPATPFLTYFALGFLILLSNFLGIASLSFVDYPLKVIMRSSKLIPTMAIGRVVLGKRYSLMHYTAAITLCAGVILFSLADMHHAQDEQAGTEGTVGGATRRLRSLAAASTTALTTLAGAAVPAAGGGASASTSTGSSQPSSSLSFPFSWLLSSESQMIFGIVLLVLSVIVDAINPNVAEFFLARKMPTANANATSRAQLESGSNGRETVPLLGGTSGPVVAPATAVAAPPRESTHGHGHASSDPLAVVRFMVGTNAAVLPLLAIALIYSGELPLVWERVRGQPGLLLLFCLYSTCSFLGVNAYTSLIKKHGSVLTVGLATLRKICTIVLSYVFIASSSASQVASDSSLPSAPGLSHPLDPVILRPPPEKHFGTHHLIPSVLIVVGLGLSAWIERNKHGAAAAPAPLSTAAAAANGHSHTDHAHASPLSGAPSSASSAASPSPPPSSAAATRLLAAELGLETDREGETSADEDGHSGVGNGSGHRLSKHASQFSQQLHRDIFQTGGESDNEFI